MKTALSVELMVDFDPGQPLRWAALSTMPPHLAGEGSTPVGYGPTPAVALTELHSELSRRAAEAAGERVDPPIQAEPLERVDE